MLPAVPGLLANEVDRRVEPFCLPTNLVALTIVERATEHRETDDVGVAGRMGESPFAVDTNEEGHVVLAGSEGTDTPEAVVRSVVGHGLSFEQPEEDLDGLREPSLADRRRVECPADGLILGEAVPGSDPDLKTAPAQMVEAGELLGEVHRMVEVVVQDKGRDADSARAVGNRHQRSERRPAVSDVIPGVHDVEAGLLRRPGLHTQIVGGTLRNLETKAKRPHEKRLRGGISRALVAGSGAPAERDSSEVVPDQLVSSRVQRGSGA